MNCEAIRRPNGGERGSAPLCGKTATFLFTVGQSRVPLCTKHSKRPFYRTHPTGEVKEIAKKTLTDYAKA